MNMNFIKSTKYTVLSGLFIALTVLLSSCEKANDWETALASMMLKLYGIIQSILIIISLK